MTAENPPDALQQETSGDANARQRSAANALFRAGKYDEALKAYQSLLSNLSASDNSTLTSAPSETSSEALDSDQWKSPESTRELVSLLNNISLCAVHLRMWPVAMDHADRALRLTQGQDAKAWYRRGSVFLESGMSNLAAFYDFKQANRLCANDKNIKVRLYNLRATLPAEYPGWVEHPTRHSDPCWRQLLTQMRLYDSMLINLFWEKEEEEQTPGNPS